MKNRVNIKPVEFDRFNYGELATIKSQATSCETTVHNPKHHFAGVGKMIEVGEAIRANLHRCFA